MDRRTGVRAALFCTEHALTRHADHETRVHSRTEYKRERSTDLSSPLSIGQRAYCTQSSILVHRSPCSTRTAIWRKETRQIASHFGSSANVISGIFVIRTVASRIIRAQNSQIPPLFVGENLNSEFVCRILKWTTSCALLRRPSTFSLRTI